MNKIENGIRNIEFFINSMIRFIKTLFGWILLIGGSILVVIMLKFNLEYLNKFIKTINSTTDPNLVSQITLHSNMLLVGLIVSVLIVLIGSILLIEPSRKKY